MRGRAGPGRCAAVAVRRAGRERRGAAAVRSPVCGGAGEVWARGGPGPMAAGTAPRLKRLLTKAGRPCALREPEMDCEGPKRARPGRQAAARPGEAQSWQASAPSAEGSCGGASARRGHIRHGRIRLALGRKARGERGHRVLVFPRTATWIGSFSGIKAGPACSGFGHLSHGMDALLYNSPVAGRASPAPHCQRGSPGVLVPGLGLFAAVQEQFHSKEVAVSVRRPVFQLDIGVLWLQDLQSPTDIIPDDVKIEQLNYRQLSRATGISLHVVQRCVRETVLLYCHLLRNKAHVSFAFKNIGVMTYEDDFLCMRFLSSCITTLESNASLTALLHSRIWPAHPADFGSESTAHGIQVLPRFQLTVKKSRAEAAAERNAAVAQKMSRGGTAGRLLQKRKTLPPSMLLQYQAGSRQQDVAKKPSASVLPPCAGSSHGTKQAGQKEPSTPAQTSTALPATEDSKRVLQELREVSALWNEADRTWPVYQQQVEQTRAERAAWEGWSAGEDQPPLQRFASASVWAPRPPAQPRGQQVGRRWRKDVDPLPGSKMGTATKLALHADLLSPRAAQVLQRLEPHLHQQEAFADTAERNRQKLELKRQLPCARCSYRSRGEGAGNSAGAVGKGAGKLSGFPPVNGKS